MVLDKIEMDDKLNEKNIQANMEYSQRASK